EVARMDRNGHHRPVASISDSPERQFRSVSRELDAALWRLILRPSTGTLGVLQIGAVVELMPNVYIQAVRLMHKQPYDRYVRLWCVVPTEDGEAEERTLLCFYTQGFPDPQFTQTRPGMDLNLAWWEAVRGRLEEIAVELGAQADLQALEGELKGVLGLPRATGGLAPSTTYPPAQRSGAQAIPLSHEVRRSELVTHEASVLFDELKRERDEALTSRDEIDAQLAKLYFAAYPYMRQALKHLAEVDLGELIAKWAREGCPTPHVESEGASTEAIPEQRLLPPAATAASTPDGAWALALQLESVQALVRERTRMLERLCELSGGHQPVTRRDGATGRPQTVCERCGAQLFHRDSDARDGWVN
ncbi:MAG TPA: hypothetical protein VGP82_02925, partial [Ktedonobacterales bacterium]|nr:hypothetical protein [Ktedonobacterales bacterium]